MSGYYQTALICTNGHVITACLDGSERDAKHCKNCGAETVRECEQCNNPIRGSYHFSNIVFIGSSDYSKPNFCHNCGQPYPWTKAGLEAANELVQFLEGVTDAERLALTRSLDDLVRETPRTEVAAFRFKQVMAKAGKEGADAVKNVLTGILTEAARRAVWG